MSNLHNIMAATLALATAAPVMAAMSEKEFSYPQPDSKTYYYGTSKTNETYDVAICIDDPSLAGKQIKGVNIALASDALISDATGWLSSELKLESKKNVADIASKDATSEAGNQLSVTFDQPYTITDKPVYAGFSFYIAKLKDEPEEVMAASKNPVPYCAGSNPNGFFIHTSRTVLKWTSRADQNQLLDMEVILQGEFADYAVSVKSVGKVRTTVEPEYVQIPVTLVNYGSEEVKSIGYEVSFGGKESEKGECTLTAPINAKFGSLGSAVLQVPTYGESAEMTVRVLTVDGQPNSMNDKSAGNQYVVMAFVPRVNPLMEEYTGLWCGWCPRGFVAMEKMSEMHSGFICASYHSENAGQEYLQFVGAFPNEVGGYPGAVMNRAFEVDPYYGTYDDGFGIEKDWLDLCEGITDADIEASLEWADDDHTRLICRSNVRFISDVNSADYVVNYVITGNGFKNVYVYDEDGKLDAKNSVIISQSNNYSSYSATDVKDDSPLWDPFLGTSSKVTDLVWNDIVMYSGSVAGSEAFPAVIKANENTASSEYEIDYTKVVNMEATPRNLLPEDGTLRCIAVLLTADGQFVNAAKSETVINGVGSSVGTVAGGQKVSSEYFDLQGRRVVRPADGMYIRVDRHADGSTKASAVTVK